MTYKRHFHLADDVLNHLDSFMTTIADPFIQSRYVGLVAIAAVTAYELAIKDIFHTFANKKHKVLESFVGYHFKRINGRIKIKTIKNDYVTRFGDKYLKRFTTKLSNLEDKTLRDHRVSVVSAYSNVIEWRNQFAHQGKIPNTATYDEIKKSYQTGKAVIICLADSMKR